MPILAISDMLDALLVNSDNNRYCHHMDGMEKLQDNMDIRNHGRKRVVFLKMMK